jgi:hypothetical protein
MTLFDRVFDIVSRRIRYKDWWFAINSPADGFVAIRVTFVAPDNDRCGALLQHYGRPWLIDPASTDDEIIRTALLAVLTAEEHESREQFLVDGVAPYHPHQHVAPPSPTVFVDSVTPYTPATV